MSDAAIGEVVRAMMEQPAARALITPIAAERLHRVVGAFPERLTRTFGFESRMDSDDERTDLFVRVEPQYGGRAALQQMPRAWAQPSGPEPAAWRAIGQVAEVWERGQSRAWQQVRQLWFEFDVAGQDHEVPVPAMLFWHGGGVDHQESAGPSGLEPGPHLQLTREVVSLLQGSALPAEVEHTLERCLRELPRGGQVFCIGVMMERRSRGLRLCLKGIPAGAHVPYLERIGVPAVPSLTAVVELATQLADSVQLCLDVGAKVAPKVHLELRCDTTPGRAMRARWRGLLDALIGEGRVQPAKARALEGWLGPAWKLSVGTEPRLVTYERRISHVKLAWSPDEGVRCKGYFGLWSSPRAGNEDVVAWTADERLADAQRARACGNAARAAGRLDRALEHQRAALRLCRQALGPRHSRVAGCLNGVGVVLQELGRCDEALEHYEQALSMLEEVGHPVGTAIVLANIGESRLAGGDPERAVEPLQRALDLLDHEGDRASPLWIGECCFNLARALRARGARPAQWRRPAQRANAALADAGPEGEDMLGRLRRWQDAPIEDGGSRVDPR